MEIKKLGVGCGQMGSGIVRGLRAGRIRGRRRHGADNDRKGPEGHREEGSWAASTRQDDPRREERHHGQDKDEHQARGPAGCDLIEEAIPEDLELKKKTFAGLDRVCKPETIFGSNTSGLSVTDMAVATKRQERVMGMHFHNPAPVMQLLETVQDDHDRPGHRGAT